MILVDSDSKPEDTILYLSAKMLKILKYKKSVHISFLDDFFNDINPNQPRYKYYLCLNFLFLIEKIEIDGSDLIYVS
ncbi:ABC-three component system middle component 6 [Lysinibacillus xylanilyticus]|uniref:ABC-three component system middle component 6 n=1 Tax=Lysinibacillus xylanilyticus TaxID=582475 RepID=UPI003D03C32F